MKYTLFQVGDQEFKLRAAGNAIINLEKQLGGQNPLNVLMGLENGQLPSVTATLYILHAALQKFHHGMTFPKVVELYDDYVESGKSYTDLIPVLVEVLETSGFFPKTKTESTEEATP